MKYLDSGPIAEYWGAGHFMALRFQPGDEDATVSVGLDPSEGSGLVPLDADLNGVFKVTTPETQTFVVETVKDGETLRQTFGLSGLTLEARPAIVADTAQVTLRDSTTDPIFRLSVDGEPWTPDAAPVVTFDGEPATLSPESPEGGWFFVNATEDFGIMFGVDAYGEPIPPGSVCAEWVDVLPREVEIGIGDVAGVYEPATVTATVIPPVFFACQYADFTVIAGGEATSTTFGGLLGDLPVKFFAFPTEADMNAFVSGGSVPYKSLVAKTATATASGVVDVAADPGGWFVVSWRGSGETHVFTEWAEPGQAEATAWGSFEFIVTGN